MILQALVQYYEALAAKGKIAKPGWGLAKISYALNLDKEGRLLDVIPLKEEQQRGKKTVEVPKNILLPEAVKRSSGVAAQFLWDNSSYILGMDNKGKPERTKQCFEACRDRHLQVLENAGSAAATAVKKYFACWNCENAAENSLLQPYLDDLLNSANITFCVENEFACQDDAIRKAWDEYNRQQDNGEKHRCLVTGKLDKIPAVHPNIKGIRGAQSSGASLVAFNCRAYESYGHVDDQCLNAPVGAYAAFAYTTALNTLIASESNKTVLGDMTVLYWSEDADEVSDSVIGYMAFDKEDIKDAMLKQVLDAFKGNESVDLSRLPVNPDNRFYILGLSPNAARLSVRFFLASTFGGFIKNLQKYYEDVSIVKPSYDNRVSIPLWQILMETANKNSKDKAASPLLAGAAVRSILNGGRYPQALYQNILLRCKADQDNEEKRISKINRIKASVIKACLRRNYNCKEAATMVLDENCNDIAYVLGRLFAVMEHIQEKANPNINSTIKDRYFNSACANPKIVFPILEKMSNYYRRKLAADKKISIYFEKLFLELYNKIEISEHPIPAHMNMENQGKFILGYYHQVQKRYEKANKEEK